MNTSDLTIFRIPVETDPWYRFRLTGLTGEDSANLNCPRYEGGIGASEVGIVLGLQKKYRPCLAEVFHYKLGTLTPSQQANRAMIRGKIFEPYTADIWRLFQGDESWVTTIWEFLNGKRDLRENLAVRNCRNLSGYYVNNNYPYLFSSLDYFAERNTPGVLNGEAHADGFPVECKTISTNYSKIWQDGVPPMYIAQINQEMICTNSDYGEIAVLFPDDFRFQIFPFNRDEKLCKQIIEYGREFWNRVMEGREAKTNMDRNFEKGNLSKANEYKAIIDSMEPEPDDGEAFKEYLKEGIMETIPSVPGEMPLYWETMEYKVATELIKLMEEKQTGIYNHCLDIMNSHQCVEINFDSAGKVTYRADKNGKRTMRFDTKPIFSVKDKAEKEFEKLNFNVRQK